MNLYVGNLSPETTEADLRTIFSEFGEIVSVKILLDPVTGLPRGFGFVEMADKYHGYDAITNLDMTYYQGNVINVRESKPKTGAGSSSGGYNNRGGNNRGGSGGFSRDRNSSGGAARPRTSSSGRERTYNSDRSGSSYNRDNNANRETNYNKAESNENFNTNQSENFNTNKSLYNTDEDLNFNKL